MNTLKKALPLGFIIAILLVWFFVYVNSKNVVKYGKISINETPISVEIVEKEVDLMKGLSGKTELKEGEGMWFIFLKNSKIGIWMRDMKFSIDILWLDKNLKIVDIKENASPESYPEVFYSRENSRYVLEVMAGFVQKHEIKIGDTAKISKVNF